MRPSGLGGLSAPVADPARTPLSSLRGPVPLGLSSDFVPTCCVLPLGPHTLPRGQRPGQAAPAAAQAGGICRGGPWPGAALSASCQSEVFKTQTPAACPNFAVTAAVATVR